MFRRSVIVRINAFALFLKECKGRKELAGLTVPQRGPALGALYRALTKNQLTALRARAAKIPPSPRKPRHVVPTTHAPTKYNLFIKQQMSVLPTGPQKDRMKAAAQLWREQQSKPTTKKQKK
ncbi:kinetoplast-associated protein 4, putative [Bodo saltans]|uniref:Kinetoplast-associated protein 4, putative n=1 Tax=Bodo saltans TaxID=75058 RepID=A0A0S4JL06_BODSA|nr:kinetoplast-associated protein 4, putative [Bodo saltans]|eukprot:CUG89165.1 kinetoplast-associated protein 4, putative [Bodo saltans]